jgi:hypothetical protein
MLTLLALLACSPGLAPDDFPAAWADAECSRGVACGWTDSGDLALCLDDQSTGIDAALVSTCTAWDPGLAADCVAELSAAECDKQIPSCAELAASCAAHD